MSRVREFIAAGLGSGRRIARRFTKRASLERSLSPYLPETICIDVGASYFPHTKWHLFLAAKEIHWVAVEPNKNNLSYIDTWAWPSKISPVTVGLSEQGGPQTLYVTNVDSGSSLLEPVISPSMSRRLRNMDYFFPLRKQMIETMTLAQVIEATGSAAPVFVKLDTQGTELSILSGADELLKRKKIIGIEMEATLLAQPVMQGSGKFWQACQFLEGRGFELLHVKPIYGPSRYPTKARHGLTYLNECDAVFALRQDVIADAPASDRAALLAFYLCNALFEEGMVLLTEDGGVQEFLASRGCSLDSLSDAIARMT